MAKHRIRRWLQFGVLDLLILTTVVAIAAVLWRPVQARTTTAPPLLLGLWINEDVSLGLLPHGSYFWDGQGADRDSRWKFPWRLSRFATAGDRFAIECGDLRLIVRSEWGSDAVEVLNEDGKVK